LQALEQAFHRLQAALQILAHVAPVRVVDFAWQFVALLVEQLQQELPFLVTELKRVLHGTILPASRPTS
jgi:hypothetical protein